MDERTQSLLGPEPAPDPLAAKALARQVEEEDVRLRVQLGRYAATAAVFALLLAAPWLSGLRAIGRAWPWIVWTLINLPLLVLVTLTLHRGRTPLGHGRVLTGPKARRLAFSALAFSLLTFFGSGLARQLWEWVVGPSW